MPWCFDADYLISKNLIVNLKKFQDKAMDLKQIESFVRVAELGSFTGAEAALGVPKPLLSLRCYANYVSK